MRLNPTEPLPQSFPEYEIALMTAAEFLDFKNEQKKYHGNDAYDFDLAALNHDYGSEIGHVTDRSTTYYVRKRTTFYEVTTDDKLVGIIHSGVMYYDNSSLKSKLPTVVFSDRGQVRVDLDVQSYKQVKYLSELPPILRPMAEINQQKYPVVIQNIVVDSERMTVRAEKTPELNEKVNLAIVNSDGYVVAVGQNEWGATLLVVAREYRGRGLGKIIGKYWYQFNPASKSGGFTGGGESNALALWRVRVNEFLARGWYSQLVKEGIITRERVKAILKDAEQQSPSKPKRVTESKATDEILIFSDGVMFIIYDRAFLEEPNEKFIHGFGFFRDSEDVGTFVFRIEYDRPFAELATRVALQMAKNNGDQLYDGGGYNDMLEYVDNIPGIKREGNYITVTHDPLPLLRQLSIKEKRIRKAVDPFDEKYYSLQEIANYKWN